MHACRGRALQGYRVVPWVHEMSDPIPELSDRLDDLELSNCQGEAAVFIESLDAFVKRDTLEVALLKRVI